MSRIESLKEQARQYEQNEQWKEALDLYNQAIDRLSKDDMPDIALFNRAGDLATKIGSAAQAVSFYERAVDFYVSAGLPNNAIAVCKKVMRNLPDRFSIHLKMGQIRAAQGFISDARTSFVTYAQRVEAAGDLEEAFRALIEFVNLVPDDYEIRMILAAQLKQNDRADEALLQYVGVYRTMRRQGLDDLAEKVAEQIRTMDPHLDLEQAASDEVPDPGPGAEASAPGAERGGGDVTGVSTAGSRAEADVVGPVDLPLLWFDDDDDAAPPEAAAAKAAEEEAARAAEEAAAEAAEEASARAAEEAAAKAAEEEAARAAEEAAAKAAEEAAAEAAEEAAARAAEEAAAKAAEEAAAKAAEEEAAKAAEEAAAKAAEEASAARAADEEAARAAEEAAARAADVAAAQAAEVAAAKVAEEAAAAQAADEAAAEAVEEAAAKFAEEKAANLISELRAQAAEEATAARAAEAAAAKAAEEAAAARVAEESAAKAAEDAAAKAAEEAAAARVAKEAAAKAAEDAAAARAVEDSLSVSDVHSEPEASPTTSSESYIDLGAVLLGEEASKEEKSTRFVVPFEEPTGDDQADFQRMLTQFQEQVSINIDANDVAAHYDLGTAYKEMGLFDEAIGEFQMVLRGNSDHLPTYEMLGQTFLEKEEPEAALRSLNRGLDAPFDVEEERVGIYYYLGLAHETTGNKDTALEYYDRVFALDINFEDVTERLRGLRG